MTLTDTQYQSIMSRLTKLERAVSDLITAHTNFVTNREVMELTTLNQETVGVLQEAVVALTVRLESLEEEPHEG